MGSQKRRSGPSDHPQNVTRPPYIYGTALIMAVTMHLAVPLPFVDDRNGLIAGAVLIAAAAVMIGIAFWQFRRAKTAVDPMKPSTTIVSNGLFAFSRNPIYLGMTLAFFGAGLALNNLWVVIMAAPVLFVMHFGVIRREEDYLEAKFGDCYRAYKQRVRRWI